MGSSSAPRRQPQPRISLPSLRPWPPWPPNLRRAFDDGRRRSPGAHSLRAVASRPRRWQGAAPPNRRPGPHPRVPIACRRAAPARGLGAGVDAPLRKPEPSQLFIDSGFYPLGSCTMKYNPKINEWAARLHGFAALHPFAPDDLAQGTLQLLWELEQALAEISGMKAVTLQPAAGAQGELTGILMIRAYHRSRGDVDRTEVLVPDSAHGTNPATASMAGFKTCLLYTSDAADD